MGLQRRLVLIDFVEVVSVLVLRVLQHVEPETAGFVPLGAQGVDLDRLEAPLLLVRLHAYLHPDCEHVRSPSCCAPRRQADGNEKVESTEIRKKARVGSTRRARDALGRSPESVLLTP